MGRNLCASVARYDRLSIELSHQCAAEARHNLPLDIIEAYCGHYHWRDALKGDRRAEDSDVF
jgi:hypothetical protein